MCIRDSLGEALAAIDRTVGLGLKGNLGLAAAGSANSGEVLAGTAGSVLAGVEMCIRDSSLIKSFPGSVLPSLDTSCGAFSIMLPSPSWTI